MQIRITDFDLERAMKALDVGGFGTHATSCEVQRRVETVAIWTEKGPEGPHGYDVGIIRREMSGFASRYEMVLETGRIPADRLTDLVGRMATSTPLPVLDRIAA